MSLYFPAYIPGKVDEMISQKLHGKEAIHAFNVVLKKIYLDIKIII